MSIKRYDPCNHRSCDDGMAERPTGKYVRYEDYALLKTEVEQLTLEKELDEVDRRNGLCCDAKYRFEELEAQVERLTKAGDAMDAYLKRQDGTTNGMLDCRRQWHDARNQSTQ